MNFVRALVCVIPQSRIKMFFISYIIINPPAVYREVFRINQTDITPGEMVEKKRQIQFAREGTNEGDGIRRNTIVVVDRILRCFGP